MKRGMAVLLVCLALLGLAGALWLRDEPLDLRAVAWLEPPEPGESEAYCRLLGLDAPLGQDSRELGCQRLAVHRQWRAAHGFDEPMPKPADEPEPLALPSEALCVLGEGDCLARLRRDRAALDQLVVGHAELLQRYEQLLALDDYRSLGLPSPDEPLASFASLERANRLLAARALQLAEQGRGGEARDLLQEDVRRLRVWLARADNLILKMVLVRLLGRDLDALAVLWRAGLVERPARQAPLSAVERSLEEAMRREFALVGGGLLSLEASPQLAAELGVGAWGLRLGYKPRMTVNDSLRDYLRVARASALETPEFVRDLGAQGEQKPDLWRRLRNPVGAILGGIAMPDFNRYLARLHDLDAKLALFNALGEAAPTAGNPWRAGQRARWDQRREAYCFAGPLKDTQGLRCLPWTLPES